METAYRALEKETSQPGSDKSALEALYGLYRNTANDGYTEESWQAFQAALEGAKKILEGEAASQEDVYKRQARGRERIHAGSAGFR